VTIIAYILATILTLVAVLFLVAAYMGGERPRVIGIATSALMLASAVVLIGLAR